MALALSELLRCRNHNSMQSPALSPSVESEVAMRVPSEILATLCPAIGLTRLLMSPQKARLNLALGFRKPTRGHRHRGDVLTGG